ncbi:MAG: hypothetical protein K2X91_04965 [Thermoleophilia bacterium]|nr:hypothetical protein [Thermoleophilia bacterium]
MFQGIQTGADAYTRRIERRLSAEGRRRLAEAGCSIGDPILELPPQLGQAEPWRSSPEVLARSPEPRAIVYGALDEADHTLLVVMRDSDDPPPAVVEELDRWRPILATRAEIARNPRRRWWAAAWPRDARLMRSPKVIALYRTDRGRFALDEAGDWQPSIKSTLVVGREPTSEPVAYLCGLLNSELLDLWYAVRGKTPWHVRRNYEPRRMNEIPYRRPEGDPRAERIAALVREVAANRRALLPHRPFFRELSGLVKDPWRTGPLTPVMRAFVADLDPSRTVSVRLDDRLTVDLDAPPPGRLMRDSEGALVFRRGRRETGRIQGPPPLLDLVEALLDRDDGSDPSRLPLPKDLDDFRRAVEGRTAEVIELLRAARSMVEEVERLVCALYGLPDDVTQEVVDHAVRRAARAARGGE